jgi:hypothetical protein
LPCEGGPDVQCCWGQCKRMKTILGFKVCP